MSKCQCRRLWDRFIRTDLRPVANAVRLRSMAGPPQPDVSVIECPTPHCQRPAHALQWPRSIIFTIQAEDATLGVLRGCGA